jgi:uncharacterized phage protein (TIGR02218 family)
MKQLTQSMMAHFNGNLTCLSTCWKVIRRDGEVLGFTDHDVSLTIDGLKYHASSGYFRSAIANSATTAVDNLEIRGFLNHEFISEGDLRNGLYDFAEVEIFAVNWSDLSMGICRLRYGYFGEVAIRPSGLFVVELRGLMQLFSQTVGETLGPDCRADLGDNRCKVKLLPPVRTNGAYYGVGDRVLVPHDRKVASSALPVLNQDFDWYQNTSYLAGTGWETLGAVFTNYPLPPRTPSYYIRPTSNSGSVRREVLITQKDPNTGINDYVPVSTRVHFRVNSPGWQMRLHVEFLNRGGIGGTSVNIIHLSDSPWYDCVHLTPEQEATLGTAWQEITLSAGYNSAQFTDVVNRYRFSIQWRPKPPEGGGQPATGPAMIDIDEVVADFYSDEYDGFSLPNTAGSTGVAGWSNGFTTPGTVNLVPKVSTAYAVSENQDMIHSMNLEGSSVDLEAVDAGDYILRYDTGIAARDWGYRGKLMVEFRNAANALISVYDPPWQNFQPERNWFDVTQETRVPPTTRIMRLIYRPGRQPERVGGVPHIAVDYLRIEFVHIGSSTNNIAQFGGLEYEALVAGTAAPEQPVAFSHTLGEHVTDGNVLWAAVMPKYTFYGVINEVFSHTEFTCLPGIDAPDNWFTWGVLTFLSGANRGRGSEVLTYRNSDRRFQIMLPALNPITLGTEIRVHTGCDKTRGPGGCARFDNILNYRGEPEVPGTDQYFRVGGTGAKGTSSSTERPMF